MFLSRVELDLRNRETMRALAAPQHFHGAVEAAFAGERARRLWRLDRLDGRLFMLIVSEAQPDLAGIAAQFGPAPGQGLPPTTRDYAPFLGRLAAGQVCRFRLAANPVERLGMIAGSSLQQHFFLYGFLAVLAVSLLRFRFAGFPIHPILFLIWGSYPSNCAWASFLIGWFIKQLVVRFGGGGVYQKCKPLFVGLIAGEILVIGITIAMDFAYYLATGSQSPVRIWFMPG